MASMMFLIPGFLYVYIMQGVWMELHNLRFEILNKFILLFIWNCSGQIMANSKIVYWTLVHWTTRVVKTWKDCDWKQPRDYDALIWYYLLYLDQWFSTGFDSQPRFYIGHYTVPSTNIGTLGKYEQRRLWKLICIVYLFYLSFKKFTKFQPIIEVKQLKVGRKSHCEINAFSSSCWPQLFQRPFPKITALSFLL